MVGKVHHDQVTRRAAMSMIARGRASIAEVTKLAGVPRQVMHYWVEHAGMGQDRVRWARLVKEWRALLDRERKKL